MSDYGFGTQGAARQSWKEANPRTVLKDIMTAAVDPHDKHAIHEEFLSTVAPVGLFDNVDNTVQALVTNIIEYWFDNNYLSALRGFPKPKAAKPAKPAKSGQQGAQEPEPVEVRVQKVREKVKQKVEEKAKALLLEMIAPNGKKVRHLLPEECEQIGGWYRDLAVQLKPGQEVGEVWSEDQVRTVAPKIFL